MVMSDELMSFFNLYRRSAGVRFQQQNKQVVVVLTAMFPTPAHSRIPPLPSHPVRRSNPLRPFEPSRRNVMKPSLQQTRWLRVLLCAFFSAMAVLSGLALVAAANPAYAHDDDDDGDQDRHESKGSRDFSIEVLSGRPDMIAGGDSLIQIRVKKKEKRISLDDMTVRLNGVDITAQFLANHAARTLTGLVTIGR